jgi:hypothetical protein
VTRIATFAIGFGLMVAYCPALSGATTTLRWDMAVPIAILLFLSQDGRMTRAHGLGLALLGWLAASIAWSSAPYYGINIAAQLLACAVAFACGSTLDDVRPLTAGAAAGLALSSLIAVAQWLGWNGIERYGAEPAGLFYNPNRLAEVAAIVIAAALALRMWWAIGILTPALVLPQGRGAWLAVVVVGLVYVWRRAATFERFLMLTIAAELAMLYAMLAPAIEPPFKIASVSVRMDLWSWTLAHLTWLGHGLGSFDADSPIFGDMTRAQYPHNEILWLGYEGGVVAVSLCGAMAVLLWRSCADELRLVLVALGVVALVAMPLHDPATVLFAALVAGHLAGAGDRVRAAADIGRPAVYRGRAAAAA